MYFDMTQFGERLRKLRTVRGLTQEQLCSELNISERHIRRIESGMRAPSIDLLAEMSVFFNISLDYLVLGKQQPMDLLKQKVHDMTEFLLALESEL